VTDPVVERATVTVNEACRLAQVSRRTLYNWMTLNKVAYVRTSGGARRIYLDTLFRPGNADQVRYGGTP
jgi:excisionase family DNA binding protein